MLPPFSFFLHTFSIFCVGRRVEVSLGFFLQLNALDERFQPILEILDSQFLTPIMLLHVVDSLGWDQDVANDLNDTVGGNAIFDGHL